MKKIKKHGYQLLAILSCLLVSNCKEQGLAGFDEYAKIHMPQASLLTSTLEIPLSDIEHTVFVGAAYGGNRNDYGAIAVTFQVDEAAVQSFNERNNTNYELLPKEAYEWDSAAAVIASGQMSSKGAYFRVNPFGALSPFVEYLLPVEIASTSGTLPINEQLKTTYYLFKTTLVEKDRSSWEVISRSSEEWYDSGTGDKRGYAQNMFDGDITSFWHTAYNNQCGWCPQNPPHWAAIDMKETVDVQGFTLIPRQDAANNDANPQDLYFEISADGETWRNVGEFSLPISLEKQYMTLEQTTAGRYFRITVTKPYNQAWANIAELGVF